MNRTFCRRPRRGAVIFLIVFLLLFSLLPAYATSERTNVMLPAYATSERTDDELLSDAYAAYVTGDWLQAALLFSAYVDRQPALLQLDSQRRQNVETCLNYARSRLQQGLVAAGNLPDVQDNLHTCRDDLRSCQTGSGVKTSFIIPSIPTPPVALPLPAGAAAEPSYPLVCRGGGGLYFTYVSFSRFWPRPQMWIRYDKAPSRVGMSREEIGRLGPGQCAWLDRAVADAEPGEIHLRDPLLDSGHMTLSWTGGRVMGTTSGAPYTSLQASDRYVTFFVYNDRQGNFVVTDVHDCTPGPEEVGLFVDFGYRATCRVMPIGNYLSAEAMGLPNDTLSSIMVGSGVRAYLCRDANLGGVCEFFTADDANLSDNGIGNDQVTSVRVERRDACIPGPNEAGLFMNFNYKPPCVRKSIGRYDAADAIGLPNDSISSVMVGKNVTLTLCMHGGQTGPCELFVGDDQNLSDNTIGNDQATSASVRSR